MDFVLPPFLIPIIVAAIIQVTKLLIDLVKHKKMYIHDIWTAGGFPSFHAGIMTSVTTLVFLLDGWDSTLFAVLLPLTLLISYDAMNVRYEAGKHARYLNSMRLELKDVLRHHATHLNERIGHTPVEVLGGVVFGLVLTVLLYYCSYVW